jgi:hypothetical protein
MKAPQAGLDLAGPAHWGYGEDFVPVEERFGVV